MPSHNATIFIDKSDVVEKYTYDPFIPSGIILTLHWKNGSLSCTIKRNMSQIFLQYGKYFNVLWKESVRMA